MGDPRHLRTPAEPCNPNSGHPITQHVSPHCTSLSATRHGRSLGYKAPSSARARSQPPRRHLVATHGPHQARKEGGEGRRRGREGSAARGSRSPLPEPETSPQRPCRRSCSARHCTASPQPCLVTALPRHGPASSPHRYPTPPCPMVCPDPLLARPRRELHGHHRVLSNWEGQRG